MALRISGVMNFDPVSFVVFFIVTCVVIKKMIVKFVPPKGMEKLDRLKIQSI